MKCTLMHKRIAVAEMELDDMSGFIRKIYQVLAPEHLPVGVSMRKGIADRAALNDWWAGRSIPASRSGIQETLEILNVPNTRLLLTRSYGLSLSDQYWIRPENSGLTWEKINFFDHSFSEDIGDVLLGYGKKKDGFQFLSPDNTSDGCLRKRWKMIDGKRCLIKGGSNPFQQQPLNEVIASEMMERLGIAHVPYRVIWSGGMPYSVCENFVTADTELVSAWRVMQIQKKANNVSVYQHFINCCHELGGPDIRQNLDEMLVLDYLIANEDRHLNNFGLLRNAQNLQWIGFAPIYDSGSSLGYDKVAAQIIREQNIVCKPFKNHHAEQIKLVTSFEWIDFSGLPDCRWIAEILKDGDAADFIGKDRRDAIVSSVEKRIRCLEKIAIESHGKIYGISTKDDVKEDIAEEYM